MSLAVAIGIAGFAWFAAVVTFAVSVFGQTRMGGR